MLKAGIFLLLTVGGMLHAGDVTDWVAGLGGKVQRDTAGDVVAVNLRGTWVDDVEMIDIARLPKLQRLDLSHTRITDEGMLYLKPANQIEDLNLYYAEWVTDQGMTAVKNWKKLKRLDLRGTRISNGTLEIVSHMPQLEALDISYSQVTDNGMDMLITLTGLKELSLGQGRVGAGDLGFLRVLTTLTSLDIGGAKPTPPDMGDRQVRHEIAPPLPANTVNAIAELKELRALKMAYTGVSAANLKALSVLENVEKLGLEECPRVDDAALAELVSWKRLKYLDLQDTKVTEQGVAALRKAKPDLVILTTLGSPPQVEPPASAARQQ
jgi:Leucine-rich repeat (LRR) protein